MTTPASHEMKLSIETIYPEEVMFYDVRASYTVWGQC